jgi:hypothetical protein
MCQCNAQRLGKAWNYPDVKVKRRSNQEAELVNELSRWFSTFVARLPDVKMLPVRISDSDDLLTLQEVNTKAQEVWDSLDLDQQRKLRVFLNQIDDPMPDWEALLFHTPTFTFGNSYHEACPSNSSIVTRRPATEFVNPPRKSNDLDPKDVVGKAALEEKQRRAPFQPEDGVLGLVNYKWYRQNADRLGAGDLPDTLKAFIRREFRRLAEKLPERPRNEVRKWHIEFSNPQGRTAPLWIGSIPANRVVYMTPLFVRSIFLDLPLLRGDTGFRVFESACARRDFELVLSFIPALRDQIDFALAHEMAHGYLHLEFSSELEGMCDKAAVDHLRLLGRKPELGAFERILVASFQEGQPRLWGFDDTQRADIVAVQKRLDDLKTLLNPAVQK